jgi:hypothetical protein
MFYFLDIVFILLFFSPFHYQYISLSLYIHIPGRSFLKVGKPRKKENFLFLIYSIFEKVMNFDINFYKKILKKRNKYARQNLLQKEHKKKL